LLQIVKKHANFPHTKVGISMLGGGDMKRSNLIQLAMLGGGISLFSACSHGERTTESQRLSLDQSTPTIRWRMATSWPKALDILYGGVQSICRDVNEMTNGKFTITPYAPDEIVSAFGVMDAVSAKTVECGHTASYYYFQQHPALAFATNVPFGLNADQQNAWLYYGGGLEIIQKIYASSGIINFPAGNTGVQMGGWFRQEINGLSDFQGLKMRIPGFGGEVMKRLGVEVKLYSADKIVPAFIAGEIDAVEWNNPYDDEVMGLSKAAPYYYYPGWWEPGATYDLLINLDKWKQLPPAYQMILRVAATNANSQMLSKYNALNGKVLARLRDGGTQLRPFSQEMMQTANKYAFAIYEEYAQRDQTFREVYQQWSKFRTQVNQWIHSNEMNYFSFSVDAAKA
jgi:TRAP-type mannitol/chloroaromatic compound transport system substrate-binding protein